MGWRWMVGLALAGCGPIVVAVDDGGAGDGESSSGSTTSFGMTTSTTSNDVTSTSTSTSGDDDDSDTIDTDANTTASFIPDPTGTCFAHCSDCDIWAQDCPRGEKCVPWANDGGTQWNASRCSPIPDAPARVGEPCTVEGSTTSGIDDCEAGSMCWDVEPQTGIGTCVAFCGGSEANPLCDGDAGCFHNYEGFVLVCVPECDPLMPACALGSTCVPSLEDRFYCVPAELAASSYGDPCSETPGCGSGLSCMDATGNPSCGDETCCTALCDLSAPSCPDELLGQQCLPYFDRGAAPPGREQLGYCGMQ